jgi:hypothetical protein
MGGQEMEYRIGVILCFAMVALAIVIGLIASVPFSRP